VLAGGSALDTEFIHHFLGLEIPNFDAGSGSSNQPVTVRGEHKGVDDISGIEPIKALALGKVPQHGNAVFASRGAERTIGRNSHSVQIAVVTNKIVADSAVGEIPNLDQFVPAARNDDGGSLRRRKSDARHPFGVAIFGDGEFALTKSIPEFDGAITRS